MIKQPNGEFCVNAAMENFDIFRCFRDPRVGQLLRKVNLIMAALDDLKAAVARDTEVDQSAITLLNGLKTKLDEAIASGDPAQLQALSAQIGSSTQALADAVTANTPAA